MADGGGSDGRYSDLIEIPLSGTGIRPTPESLQAGLQFIKMKGREVFKVAVPKFVEIISEAAKKSNLELDQIDLIIPHQMNARMMQAIAERLGIPFEKFFLNLDRYGNTSAASIPLALDEAVRTGRLKRGQHVLLTGMGAGLAWGTIIIRF